MCFEFTMDCLTWLSSWLGVLQINHGFTSMVESHLLIDRKQVYALVDPLWLELTDLGSSLSLYTS